MSFRQPEFIKDWLNIYQEGGLIHLIKTKGWSVVFAFFLFYLVRDTILYIFIPYIAYTNISSCV
tara:strand:- start:74 stop:265 length:192 start_codon:yes stop_codon:yes gene_type:complete